MKVTPGSKVLGGKMVI